MTTTNREPRPYANSYLAGTALGVVLFLSFFVTGGGLGASGALSHIQLGVLRWFAQDHVNRVAYEAEVAGTALNPWMNSGVFMLLGAVIGGVLSGLVNRRFRVELRKGPNVSNRTRIITAVLGGLIMGFGARLARGCTSGQALSGGAVLSVGSWAFAFAVFGGAYAFAYFFRKLWN